MGGHFPGTSWSARPLWRRRHRRARRRNLRPKAEQWFAGAAIIHNHRAQLLTDGGAVLEAVAAAATSDPEVDRLRVAIQNKVAVGRLLVLAHARFHHRRVF